MIQAYNEMRQVKMREKEDPSVLSDQLRGIKFRYAMARSVDITDDDIERIVVQRVPTVWYKRIDYDLGIHGSRKEAHAS